MTPDEIADIAFWLIAPSGMPKDAFQARVDEITAHIRTYGDERVRAERALFEQDVLSVRNDYSEAVFSTIPAAAGARLACDRLLDRLRSDR